MVSTLAYPVACLIVMCVVFSFCDDHQPVDLSRCENSLWSTRKWWFRCI